MGMKLSNFLNYTSLKILFDDFSLNIILFITKDIGYIGMLMDISLKCTCIYGKLWNFIVAN